MPAIVPSHVEGDRVDTGRRPCDGKLVSCCDDVRSGLDAEYRLGHVQAQFVDLFACLDAVGKRP